MIFYAYPRDASGVPLNTAGLDIDVELSGPSGSPAFSKKLSAFVYDAANIRYTVAPVVTLSGEYDVVVMAGGVNVGDGGWPVVVNVRPGPTSPSMSTYTLTAGVDVGGGGTAGAEVMVTFSPRVGPSRYCSPHHRTHYALSFIIVSGSL
jgi:hypothetical protein